MAKFEEQMGELVQKKIVGEGIPPIGTTGYDINMYYAIDYIPWGGRQDTLTPPYNTYPQDYMPRIPINKEYFINWCDARVIRDPEQVAHLYVKPSENQAGGNFSLQTDVETVKNAGINYPIIGINGLIVSEEQLNYVEINVNNILPSIILRVYDQYKTIRRANIAGWNSVIIAIIVNQVEGIYKNTNLVFYISEMEEDGDYVVYKGIYKLEGFNDETYQLVNHISIPGYMPLNTFETLDKLTYDYGIGFSCTFYGRKRTELDLLDRDHSIEDYRWRLIKHMSLYDYLQEILDCSGDNKTMYDIWVDMYGYIVLLDVGYMFSIVESGELLASDLAVWAAVGIRSNMNDGPDLKGYRMQRTLTNNMVDDVDHNLKFAEYEYLINNETIVQYGTENINTSLSNLNNNEITTNNTGLLVNSNNPADSRKKRSIKFKKYNFLGYEFINEQPSIDPAPYRVPIKRSIPLQRHLNRKFFRKIRTKLLRIRLVNYNLGLQRGQIVNVIFKSYNQQEQQLLNNGVKYSDSAKGMLNLKDSGQYYIDSVQFIYREEEKKISQYLYLIDLRQIQYNPIDQYA